MSKEEFIQILNDEISSLPDHNEIISYYHELISDKIDAGLSEEEAVASLGNIDDIVKSIKENRIDDSTEFKTEAKEVEIVEETKFDENTSTNTATKSPRPLSGGRKFVYVLWCIATVVFCISSVMVVVVAASVLLAGLATLGASAYVFTKDIMVGLFTVGLGLLITGMSIVALNYSIVLTKYVFGNRVKWNTGIRKALKGE